MLNEGKADDLYKESRDYFKAGSFDQSFNFLLKAIKYRNDIETPTFRKFLNLQFEKLKFYKSYFRENSEELTKSFKLVKSQTGKINKLEKKVHELDQANSDSIRVASDLRKQVSKVKEELASCESKSGEERLLNFKKVRELNSEIDIQKRELVLAKQTISKLKAENSNLKSTISDLQLEVLRLSELSWFDKLVGKR